MEFTEEKNNMIFHYAGKYNGDENSLPYKEHNPNAIPFKEPKDMKKYSLIANLGCVLIMIVLVIPFLLMGIKYIPSRFVVDCLCFRMNYCMQYALKRCIYV